MKRQLIIPFFLLLFVSLAYAQQEPVDLQMIEKIKDEGLNRSQVMKTAFYLTDVIGPRLSGSAGLKHANEWTRQQLADWQLANATIEPWGEFGRGWDIEKSYAAMTAPYYQPLIASPKAWTPGTNGLVKGKLMLVNAEKEEDFAQYKGQLKDKIILVQTTPDIKTTFEPDARRFTDDRLAEMAGTAASAPSSSGLSPERMAEYRARRAVREKLSQFLMEEGAALVISNGRGMHGTYFTSNGASYAADAPAVLPELEMAAEHYARMLRLLQAQQEVEIETEIKTRFNTDLTGYNVVAEIPGTDKKLKSELVMVGAHLDSWHSATGATDNAAGTAVMMEAMRILKTIGIKPRRTIRIALWGSEEQGLFGSRNYVKNHFGDAQTMKLLPDHVKLSAYYNVDNGTGKIRGVYLQGNEALRSIFQAWLEPFKDMGATTVTIRNTGGTDHQSFDAVGLPGFQFIQDPVDYNTRTHHTNMDTYERLQEEDLKQAAVIVASFVYHTAMRDQKLPRKTMPEAKAAGAN
ncbi:M20/M25/M40 family metallo-hydrolase [Rhodocytophaga aerolata]|uniref:Carboxypeptidase Q n=1 Tax=Rhodocytophaga aerolata TaxID=455078 RepID=A0ABT8R7N4_9BACT|nr:M20/M25/M40 family metallo-hydrolase [Rhodocytophaga aerolata]MDO1447354.1 M20/M25/M40 family metallo-hydrolase [Rhodocytophaga aerolata]